MNLVDTDDLVDCLRGTGPAKAWLKQLAIEPFAVPAVVAMELVMGCRDRADLERIQRFLGTFEIVWPEASDFATAYDLLLTHRLSSGLNIPDCLIAATALARDGTLFTFNLKHFRAVSGLGVREPYPR
ncbi:MAG TPA: type II toxin-antitoxin system VapC family toxin [Terriglobia bacterium]|nr:type II toxin-antitoxin system VapC family toxin [Terriglobia bacterium]